MSDIEKLRKKRTAARKLTSAILNKIKDELAGETVDIELLENNLVQLIEKDTELRELNSQIEDIISVEEIEDDYSTSQKYVANILIWKSKAQCYLNEINASKINNTQKQSNSETSKTYDVKPDISLKLIKLEINKYYGDPAHWTEFLGSIQSHYS